MGLKSSKNQLALGEPTEAQIQELSKTFNMSPDRIKLLKQKYAMYRGKNSKINVYNYVVLHREFINANASDVEIYRSFNAFDKDRDGYLDFVEMLRAMTMQGSQNGGVAPIAPPNSSSSSKTQPYPMQPQPTQPYPMQPQPTQPYPMQPQQVQPYPMQPQPVQPYPMPSQVYTPSTPQPMQPYPSPIPQRVPTPPPRNKYVIQTPLYDTNGSQPVSWETERYLPPFEYSSKQPYYYYDDNIIPKRYSSTISLKPRSKSVRIPKAVYRRRYYYDYHYKERYSPKKLVRKITVYIPKSNKTVRRRLYTPRSIYPIDNSTYSDKDYKYSGYYDPKFRRYSDYFSDGYRDDDTYDDDTYY